MARRITALKLQKRNRERVNVYLDGEFAFGLARIVAAWLQVGQELTEEKIAELQVEDAGEVAHQKALKFISYRERTEAEVRKHLLEYDLDEHVVEQEITRLRHSGLVDDQRFARNWVENRIVFRPRSRRALAYELSQKGVTNETIQATLESVDDSEMAYQAACRQASRYQRLEWPDFRTKMYAYLARRGFSYDITAPIVSRVWEEQFAAQSAEHDYPKGEVD